MFQIMAEGVVDMIGKSFDKNKIFFILFNMLYVVIRQEAGTIEIVIVIVIEIGVETETTIGIMIVAIEAEALIEIATVIGIVAVIVTEIETETETGEVDPVRDQSPPNEKCVCLVAGISWIQDFLLCSSIAFFVV